MYSLTYFYHLNSQIRCFGSNQIFKASFISLPTFHKQQPPSSHLICNTDPSKTLTMMKLKVSSLASKISHNNNLSTTATKANLKMLSSASNIPREAPASVGTVSSAWVPLKEFTVFNKLPIELRIKIWKDSLPTGKQFLDILESSLVCNLVILSYGT